MFALIMLVHVGGHDEELGGWSIMAMMMGISVRWHVRGLDA